MRIVCVTGGIGSGKSVVCHVLQTLGYPVFDCDSEARLLMDADSDMKQRIASEVTPLALNADGSLCRSAISQVVFSDSRKLRALNAIVHGAVRRQFSQWLEAQTAPLAVVETAILYESGFDALVNEVWEVTAPVPVRVRRVMRRSGISADEVSRRIASQSDVLHHSHRLLVNDDVTPLIPQILQLLEHRQ